MYVVVCEDLSPSHQAVQACHAGIAAGRDLIRCSEPYLVLLTVPTQSDLVALSVRLNKADVKHRVFHEEDLGGRPTALATEAIEQIVGNRITSPKRKLFRELKMYCPRSSENGAIHQEEHVA